MRENATIFFRLPHRPSPLTPALSCIIMKERSGDKVLLSDGTLCEVERVSCKKLSEPETTYNLEVADFHTYYVSDACVLVHNAGCGGLRGSNNPNTKQAAVRGRQMHRDYNYGAGTIKEFTIPGYGRADAVDLSKRIVYELKPNNPKAIARGYKQLARYAEGLSRTRGGQWITKLFTY